MPSSAREQNWRLIERHRLGNHYMSFMRTIVAAAVLGGLAQSGVSPGTRPHQSSAEKDDAAVVRAAENLFGAIQSEVRKGLETPFESPASTPGALAVIGLELSLHR